MLAELRVPSIPKKQTKCAHTHLTLNTLATLGKHKNDTNKMTHTHGPGATHPRKENKKKITKKSLTLKMKTNKN